MIVLVSENGNKGTLHKRAIRQRPEKESNRGRSDVYRESLGDSHDTWLTFSETLQITGLPSSLSSPAPSYSTYTLHTVTMDIY